jgi:acyl-CoA dehydrogenase
MQQAGTVMMRYDTQGTQALGLRSEATNGRTDASGTRQGVKVRAELVAAVAAANAAGADREARFPEEAVAAARVQRLLGIMVPEHLGGEGARISDVADVCYRLGRACASTAMIYAMHQTKVACLVRHGRDSTWHHHLLRRLGRDQLLLASSTTEGQGGGNIRSSAAAIERDGKRISLERSATVISYGAQADGIVTTARRSPEAPSSDQVLVAFLKEDYSLLPIATWDTLGMRGTCSAGFTLKASGNSDQILPDGYDKIHAQTMTPVAHLTWASAWAGIAAAAVERAQSFIRNAARQANGQLPPGAAHYGKAASSLRMLRGLVATGLRRFELAGEDEQVLGSLDFQTAINLLKVGLAGYRNDGQFTIGRHLRDVLSSPIMINNDRILANVAGSALMSAVPASLSD